MWMSTAKIIYDLFKGITIINNSRRKPGKIRNVLAIVIFRYYFLRAKLTPFVLSNCSNHYLFRSLKTIFSLVTSV